MEDAGVGIIREDNSMSSFRRSTLQPYITSLLENLERRFPALPYLSALSVFQPAIMPTDDVEALASYGCEELALLLEIFDDGTASEAFINVAEAQCEFRQVCCSVLT